MVELFANSGDPDQTPRSVASDLGLHCLPITLLGVFRLHSINQVCMHSTPYLLTSPLRKTSNRITTLALQKKKKKKKKKERNNTVAIALTTELCVLIIIGLQVPPTEDF